MKRFIRISALLFIMVAMPLRAVAAEYLVPVGRVIGLHLHSGNITVAAFDDPLGIPAREAGLQIGDTLLAIDGIRLSRAEEVAPLLHGKTSVTASLRRGRSELELTLPLSDTAQGPRLGICLRQGISGIGTVTWYDPESRCFGALGHGVSEGDGVLLQMTAGSIYEAWVENVRKGTPGKPGQLRGCAEEQGLCGTIVKNTPQGIFGTARAPWKAQALPVADYEEVKVGAVTVRSNISGREVKDYSAEIIKIYPEDRPDGRNFLLRVTDSQLLAATGGIVQGMSGSPIIQDGKIIGAVTHVLVNDPARGYGIFIENMLEAAE